MFKKTITIAMLCLLSITSIWAVWEGNAAAGSADEFPSGLFASSDLFPKHTLVEIVNLEQNTKSRAVIVGNTGADGVLIKLSPDLAAALAVRQGTTVRVRISIPPLVAEEGADPVLLTKNSNETAVAKEEAVPVAETAAEESEVLSAQAAAEEDTKQLPVEEAASEPAPAETSIAAVSEPESPEEPVPPQEVPPVEEPVQEHVAVANPSEVEEPQKAETVAPSEEPQPIAEVEEPAPSVAEDAIQPEAVAEAAEPVEPLAAGTEEPAQPLVAALPIQDSSEDSLVYTQPVAEVSQIEKRENEAVDSTPAAVPEVAIPEEPALPPQTEPAVTDAVSSDIAPTAESTDDEPPLYDIDEGIPESLYLVDEDAKAAEPVPEVSPIEQTEAVITDEVVAEAAPPIEETDNSETDNSRAEESIAEVIPPVSEELPPVEEPVPLAAAEPEPEPPAETTAEVPLAVVPVEQHLMLVPAEPKAPRQEDVPPPPAKTKPPAVPQNKAPVVKTEQSSVRPAEEPFVIDGLKTGAFYVQIARFSDMLNVQSFVQRYGKQYPISIEKNGTGSGSFYKVYIGPLQKDERGAALETFQRLGFKDAFLKKAP